MAFPVSPLPNQFIDGNTENAASLDAKITNPLNGLRQAAMLGVLGGQTSGTNVTLSGVLGTAHATDASATVTLAYSQTVILLTTARFAAQVAGTAPASYTLQCGYNSGASATPGSATLIGMMAQVEVQAVGGAHAESTWAFGYATLAAGQYTFYGVIARNNAGDPTDLCTASQVLVLDAGGR